MHFFTSVLEAAPNLQQFSVVASNGKRYVVRTYDFRQWSANLPGGTYRAVGAPGCPGLERRFARHGRQDNQRRRRLVRLRLHVRFAR